MNHAKVIAFQRKWQPTQELPDLFALLGSSTRKGQVTAVSLGSLVKEPAGTVLRIVSKQIELVVAEYADRLALIDKSFHKEDHTYAVVAAVTEITEKD